MSFTNTANLSAGIDFTALETNSLSRITDIGSVAAAVTITQGTGEQEGDCTYHDVRTASGNRSDLLDLTALRFSLFDQDGTIAFNNIKGIVVKNQSEDSEFVINILATGNTAFTQPFNKGSGDISVHAKSAVTLMNPIVGWTVDSTHKSLFITNHTSTGINYEVAIVGVTG